MSQVYSTSDRAYIEEANGQQIRIQSENHSGWHTIEYQKIDEAWVEHYVGKLATIVWIDGKIARVSLT